jgi:large subunit ribosomal protein L35
LRDREGYLPFLASSAITAPSRRPAGKGCRGGGDVLRGQTLIDEHYGPAERSRSRPRRAKMPKIKTKSGAKKRFKVTAGGKVLYAQSGKRHGMIKRSKKQIRQLRGTNVLFKTDGDNIKKFFLPNG